MNPVEHQCKAALKEISFSEEIDNDDAGINKIVLIGRFWDSWWYLCQIVEYDSAPGSKGQYSIVVTEAEPGRTGLAFAFCSHQEHLTKRKPSPKELSQFIHEWPRKAKQIENNVHQSLSSLSYAHSSSLASEPVKT